MKYIKSFKLLESLDQMPVNPMSITEFVDVLFKDTIDNTQKNIIVEWWNANRTRIQIYYYKFNTSLPIMGCFLSDCAVAINGGPNAMNPKKKFYIALHESRHADQHLDGIFNELYFNTVVNKDKKGFLKGYAQLEADANNFAINALEEMNMPLSQHEIPMMRSNEYAGPMVYDMMGVDIKKYGAQSMFDLLFAQIL